jgi:hypothetical protein
MTKLSRQQSGSRVIASLGYRNGVPLLFYKPRTKEATLKLVNELRDAD